MSVFVESQVLTNCPRNLLRITSRSWQENSECRIVNRIKVLWIFKTMSSSRNLFEVLLLLGIQNDKLITIQPCAESNLSRNSTVLDHFGQNSAQSTKQKKIKCGPRFIFLKMFPHLNPRYYRKRSILKTRTLLNAIKVCFLLKYVIKGRIM